MTGARPILFSAPMVLAILSGQKTQTRRLCRPDRDCSFRAGDALWVREAWRLCEAGLSYQAAGGHECYFDVLYPADLEVRRFHVSKELFHGIQPSGRTRPSIHMPRALSRLSLNVTGLDLEQLQSISEADANAEGFRSVAEFRTLWDSLNAKRGAGWHANPWVWKLSFEVAPL